MWLVNKVGLTLLEYQDSKFRAAGRQGQILKISFAFLAKKFRYYPEAHVDTLEEMIELSEGTPCLKVLRKSVMSFQHRDEGQIGSRDRRDMDQRSEGRRSRIFKDFIMDMLSVMQKMRRERAQLTFRFFV